MACDVVEESLAASDASAGFLARYEQRLWEALGDELRLSSQLQQMGRVRPLLNFVLHRAARDEQVSNHICGMIANAVPKKQLTSLLYYLKLLVS